MPSDSVPCPECEEGFDSEEGMRDHFFDSHLLTRSEATHTDNHDEQTAERGTRHRKLVYGVFGTVVLAGLLGGLVAISDYYFIPPNPTEDVWLSVLVYGVGVLMIIVIVITLLTKSGDLQDEP